MLHNQIHFYIFKQQKQFLRVKKKRNAPFIEPEDVWGCCCCWFASSFEVTALHISNIGKAFKVTFQEWRLFPVTAVHIRFRVAANPICNFLPIKQSQHWTTFFYSHREEITEKNTKSFF